MSTATIIGSGPNGLPAAIVLAASGVRTIVLERNKQIGGGCSTAEVTQPGFLHDLGSSTYPLGAASPFYGSLPFTIPWIQPPAAFAHPLDDGTAVVLTPDAARTIAAESPFGPEPIIVAVDIPPAFYNPTENRVWIGGAADP